MASSKGPTQRNRCLHQDLLRVRRWAAGRRVAPVAVVAARTAQLPPVRSKHLAISTTLSFPVPRAQIDGFKAAWSGAAGPLKPQMLSAALRDSR